MKAILVFILRDDICSKKLLQLISIEKKMNVTLHYLFAAIWVMDYAKRDVAQFLIVHFPFQHSPSPTYELLQNEKV